MTEPPTSAPASHQSDDEARARRFQAVVDVVASLVLTMLAWPFPVARAAFSLPVHLLGIVCAWVLIQVLYFGLTAASWGRTPGMRLAGLALVCATDASSAAPTRAQAVRWAIITALIAPWFAVAPAAAVRAALAERAAGVCIRLVD